MAHHMAVPAPEFHILALADENIPERRMPVVAGPAEHHIHAIDLPGEKHAVSVKRKEGVFKLYKLLKVKGICHANGGAVIAIAPGNVISVLNKANSGVITELSL